MHLPVGLKVPAGLLTPADFGNRGPQSPRAGSVRLHFTDRTWAVVAITNAVANPHNAGAQSSVGTLKSSELLRNVYCMYLDVVG